MLTYDPIPWLMVQEGLAAVRARRLLGLDREGDKRAVGALERKLAKSQLGDGSFSHSVMKTAGVLNLLAELGGGAAREVVERASSYLIGVLASQPGYERAKRVRPGSLKTDCDLCGFFGPEEDRWRPDVLARNAREMNFFREYEPLLGPKSRVRGVRRSSLDRPGPGTCYTWGLIPLSCAIEALCRVGHAREARVKPAINALLSAQRRTGGWCRCSEGHPSCTLHALRALGPHPQLRRSKCAQKALEFMRSSQVSSSRRLAAWWKGSNLFVTIRAASAFDFPIAREIIRDGVASVAKHQTKNGTFGSPCKTERVAAVLIAKKSMDTS